MGGSRACCQLRQVVFIEALRTERHLRHQRRVCSQVVENQLTHQIRRIPRQQPQFEADERNGHIGTHRDT